MLLFITFNFTIILLAVTNFETDKNELRVSENIAPLDIIFFSASVMKEKFWTDLNPNYNRHAEIELLTSRSYEAGGFSAR